jgi:hypothetical protein
MLLVAVTALAGSAAIEVHKIREREQRVRKLRVRLGNLTHCFARFPGNPMPVEIKVAKRRRYPYLEVPEGLLEPSPNRAAADAPKRKGGSL